MKRIMTIIAIMAMYLICSQNVSAETITYIGKLTNVTMNGKTYDDVPNVTFTLISTNKDGVYKLKSDPIGPIGSMPGTINVDATVNSNDGVLSSDAGKKAGTLELKIGGKLNIYMTSLTGNADKSSAHFVLDTYSLEIFGIKAVQASVTFTSESVTVTE